MRQGADAACCVPDPEDARLTRLQCNARAGKGGADDGGWDSGYHETWDLVSGPLRLIQSAWHGPTVVSVPRRGHPSCVAAPLRDGAMVYSSSRGRLAERGVCCPAHCLS